MRGIKIVSKLFIDTMVAGLVLIGTAHAADLTVTIRHLRSTQGVVSVALYNSAYGFLEDGAEVRSADVWPTGDETPVVFKDLPPGEYAIAAFHNENASGEFDTNFLGMPEEGYGFSNGAKAFLGPPAFNEAAVPVENAANTELDMSY
ncbi:MAG: DUF2141 domain-containing protein [Alphaproteobacteria bacterium]|nr:DUF2141 domain-containing protein [Alphaproteobacteria bacterium]